MAEAGTVQAAAESLVRRILVGQNPSDVLVREVAIRVCRAIPEHARALGKPASTSPVASQP